MIAAHGNIQFSAIPIKKAVMLVTMHQNTGKTFKCKLVFFSTVKKIVRVKTRTQSGDTPKNGTTTLEFAK